MGFSRQECWSGLPFPSPEDLPDSGIKPRSPALQADSLSSETPGGPRGGLNPAPLGLEGRACWTLLTQTPLCSHILVLKLQEASVLSSSSQAQQAHFLATPNVSCSDNLKSYFSFPYSSFLPPLLLIHILFDLTVFSFSLNSRAIYLFEKETERHFLVDNFPKEITYFIMCLWEEMKGKYRWMSILTCFEFMPFSCEGLWWNMVWGSGVWVTSSQTLCLLSMACFCLVVHPLMAFGVRIHHPMPWERSFSLWVGLSKTILRAPLFNQLIQGQVASPRLSPQLDWDPRRLRRDSPWLFTLGDLPAPSHVWSTWATINLLL